MQVFRFHLFPEYWESRNKWDGGAGTKRSVENMPTVGDVMRDSLGGSVW